MALFTVSRTVIFCCVWLAGVVTLCSSYWTVWNVIGIVGSFLLYISVSLWHGAQRGQALSGTLVLLGSDPVFYLRILLITVICLLPVLRNPCGKHVPQRRLEAWADQHDRPGSAHRLGQEDWSVPTTASIQTAAAVPVRAASGFAIDSDMTSEVKQHSSWVSFGAKPRSRRSSQSNGSSLEDPSSTGGSIELRSTVVTFPSDEDEGA